MTAFDRYIDPARSARGWWRILIGLLFIGVCWVLGTFVVMGIWLFANWPAGAAPAEVLPSLNELAAGGSALKSVEMRCTFAGVWVGVLVALLVVHQQSFASVFGPSGRQAVRQFWLGLVLAAVFAAASSLIAMTITSPVRSTVPMDTWLLWIAPLVLLIFVQATAEELIFRGYLLQQLAARSRFFLVWGVLPSVVFGAMHFNTELPMTATILYIATTALMGVALAVLVWRTGALWAAMGVHLGINVASLTVLGAEGILSGTQIWLFAGEHIAPLLWIDTAMAGLMLVFALSPAARVFDA
ncbi:MAG: CPBP family intramembrane glutamic endopeptidase [Pseudomonadota bacterium]